MNDASLESLVRVWRDDVAATYQTWFLWEERLKNFRSIRRGIEQVVEEIEAGTFGTLYRGSSLETVVKSIAEQRQIFKGADHAFLWKPKLRIPDIYENPANQRTFGRFLETCLCSNAEDGVLAAVHNLDTAKIKGLGPAVANLMYFLHPVIVPPFNTAMVKGYNLLTGSTVRLGRWQDYLAMRAGMLRINKKFLSLFSNDLGAVAGFLYDVGSSRYAVLDDADTKRWEDDLASVRQESAAHRKAAQIARESDLSHSQVRGWLRDLGLSLGYDVWIAANDRSRPCGEGVLGDGCLNELPPDLKHLRLIDVIWFEKSALRVVAAFEVEHSTSIYSGVLRLLDLALSPAGKTLKGLYLVAPDAREKDARAQLQRPAFKSITALAVRYLAYGDLEKHREAMSRFGEGIKAVEAIARRL